MADIDPSSQYLNLLEEVAKNLPDVVRSLNAVSKAFDTYNKENDSSGSKKKANGADVQKAVAALEKSEKAQAEGVKNFQKVGEQLVNAFSKVANYAIDKFTSAAQTIIDDYNHNLTQITVRMGQNNHQYTQMLNDITGRIEREGLKRQFSQVDFTEKLTDVLTLGLRGQQAQEVAYQNMITSKLVPALNTNTRTYTRASKVLGTSFNEGITAITKFAEEQYGGEGIENGTLNSMIESFTNKILANNSGLDPMEVYKDLIGTTAEWAARLNSPEAVENMMQAYRSYMSGDKNVYAMYAGRASGVDFGSNNFSTDSFKKFAEAYVNGAMTFVNDNVGAGILNQTGLGLDETAYDAIRAWKNYGDKLSSFSDLAKNVNFDAVYSGYKSQLQGGQYQSITAQQQKWNENAVAKLSNTLAEKIPDTVALVRMGVGILSDFYHAWAASKAWEAGSSTLFGKGDPGKGDPGLFAPGGKLALTKSVEGGGSVLTGLGTAASAVAIIAGVAQMVGSGISAANAEQMSDATSLQKWFSGGVSGLTGGSSVIGWSDADKMAKAEENKKNFWNLDLGAVGKSALAWGSVGLGVGALAGSAAAGVGAAPGAVIGAAAGGLIGAATSITDQLIEMHDYNKYIDSDLHNYSETLEEQSEVTSDYISSLTRQYELNKSNDEINKKLLEAKGEEYTQLKATLAVQEAELKVLQAKYGIEASGNVEDTITKAAEGITSGNANLDAIAALNSIISESGLSSSSNINSWVNALSDEDVSNYYEEIGVSNLNINSTGDKRKDLIGLLQMATGSTKGWNYFDDIETDEWSKASYGSGILADDSGSQVSVSVQTLLSTASHLKSAASTYSDLSDLVHMKEIAKDYYKAQEELAKATGGTSFNINDYSIGDLFTGLSKEDLSSYVSKTSEKPGYYKVGLYDVTMDNSLARLHRGEMVLTRDQATKLRALVAANGGNVSTLLTELYNESNSTSEAVPLESKVSSVSSIVSAITSQTEIISSLLNVIITQMQGTSETTAAPSVNISPSLLNFSGV